MDETPEQLQVHFLAAVGRLLDVIGTVGNQQGALLSRDTIRRSDEVRIARAKLRLATSQTATQARMPAHDHSHLC